MPSPWVAQKGLKTDQGWDIPWDMATMPENYPEKVRTKLGCQRESITKYQKASSACPRMITAIADLYGKEFVPISSLTLSDSIVAQLMEQKDFPYPGKERSLFREQDFVPGSLPGIVGSFEGSGEATSYWLA
ncbi:hypothetical protein BTVI_74246 [Pitangus sulphuratus]|nr:hypothetical protein BTVI_74246 [Pitangus sulphuratus]